MNIGVDIDGVILDFQDRIRVYSEWYDLDVLNKNGVKKKDEIMIWDRYNWSQSEMDDFIDRTFYKVAQECKIIPFAEKVLSKLKNEKNKIIIITSRGNLGGDRMIDIAKQQLDDANIKYDKIYWNTADKVEVCKNEKIDFMIDDYANVCEKMVQSKIRTIYFRAKDNRKLTENYYLKEVSNWAEIYRFLAQNCN